MCSVGNKGGKHLGTFPRLGLAVLFDLLGVLSFN